jgi:hypothetical protein
MINTNVVPIHKKYFLILSPTKNGNVTKISNEKAHINNPLNEINTLTQTTRVALSLSTLSGDTVTTQPLCNNV